MEGKLLQGNEAMEKAMRQEQELLKHKAEIEEKRRNQLRIKHEIDAKNKETMILQT